MLAVSSRSAHDLQSSPGPRKRGKREIEPDLDLIKSDVEQVVTLRLEGPTGHFPEFRSMGSPGGSGPFIADLSILISLIFHCKKQRKQLVLRIIQMRQQTPLPRFPVGLQPTDLIRGEGPDPLLPRAPAFAGEARCFVPP
jgi:hypothetical protein